MTVYEIPGIENCTVEEIGNPVLGYRIIANEGWCIHVPAHAENEYAYAILIRTDYDFSTVQIIDINTLGPEAEIHGGNDDNTDVM